LIRALHANRLADFPIYWQALFRKFHHSLKVFGGFRPFPKTGTPSAKHEASLRDQAEPKGFMEEKMIKFDKADFQRFLVSAIGALVVSATCVGAAVGPARAAEVRAPLTAVAHTTSNAAQNFQLAAQ
jgi:hypothetical protein